MPILALVSDMIFDAKVTATAKAASIPVEVVRTTATALDRLPTATALIVDLHVEPASGDALAFIRTVKSQRPELPVIAFLSHVQFELADAARQAGADEVMPRSKFSKQLADLLIRLSAAREPA